VVQLTTDILKEAGFKVASISSIRFQINDREWQNKLKMTMPGRLKLQRFLRQALNKGCQYAVLEVTSEGIKQFRHKFINFDAAVLTNLTKEHIEAHGGFENYKKAKGELFRITKNIHIINLDDKSAEYFLQFGADEKWGYGIKCQNPNVKPQKFIKATDIKISTDGANFTIEDTQFHLKLLGEFNIYNSLTAACIGLSQGVRLEIIKKALEKIGGVAGRIELVVSRPFKVFVDYAHTPDALESVYKALTSSNFRVLDSNLICVLGSCGGGRDKWRRPEMGRLASRYCNKIILTNEDPYDENPVQIIEDIEKGVSQTADYEKILERREAIRRALALARPNDIVIITGKGNEPWMCVSGGKKIHWDDRQVVKEEL
jgi:UDP-N-acetylmuramoyl-L-alanyl-D-glutamate--2,6-diaminopimelate ligase